MLPARFHHADFDAGELVAARARSGASVSVCLPARDEAATVGRIVADVRRELVETHHLVDEIVVVDDCSADDTAARAEAAGARVVAVHDVMPDLPRGSGKGNAMWASLHAADGDLLCWIDADIRSAAPPFVVGLLGPLLRDPDLAFTKGFYRRPLHDEPSGGGRVTELVARPLLSQLLPDLTAFVQPLAGEYAGRRELLEAVPFVQGYGIEIGLLADVVERVGLQGCAQVDLGAREHRNRPLDELGPQATAVATTILRRAGALAPGSIAALRRFDDDLDPEVVAVEVRERPPMLTVPAYRAKFGRSLSA